MATVGRVRVLHSGRMRGSGERRAVLKPTYSYWGFEVDLQEYPRSVCKFTGERCSVRKWVFTLIDVIERTFLKLCSYHRNGH